MFFNDFNNAVSTSSVAEPLLFFAGGPMWEWPERFALKSMLLPSLEAGVEDLTTGECLGVDVSSTVSSLL